MPKKFIGNVKGVGIASVVREYNSSTSATVAPDVNDTKWQSTVPTLDSTHYLWTRLKLTLTNGKVEKTEAVREGMFGEEINNIITKLNAIAPSNIVDVAHGGTGKISHTSNAVLAGNGSSAVKNIATKAGAFYATTANGIPVFGTLPIALGGTGATTKEGALSNFGLTATATELNYMDGVTANVQAQLNGKSASTHNHDGSYLKQYGLNAINIDSTSGSWTVDISDNSHGTVPSTWVNVTQTTGAHFIVQTARKCDSSSSATGRDQRMWIRDKYSSGVWSNWKEVLTESTGHNSAKLWENTNPANSFGAQTINLDLSQYDYILLDYKGINSSSHIETDFIKVGGARYITYMRYVQSEHVLSCYSRSVNAKTTGIEFGTATRHDADWAKYETADTAIVPLAIHGIKGVF